MSNEVHQSCCDILHFQQRMTHLVFFSQTQCKEIVYHIPHMLFITVNEKNTIKLEYISSYQLL